jgi:SlyX protein
MPGEERFVDLEVRIAHQDRLLAALDEVVRDLAGRIERLERRVAEASTEPDGTPPPPDDPPPHY